MTSSQNKWSTKMRCDHLFFLKASRIKFRQLAKVLSEKCQVCGLVLAIKKKKKRLKQVLDSIKFLVSQKRYKTEHLWQLWTDWTLINHHSACTRPRKQLILNISTVQWTRWSRGFVTPSSTRVSTYSKYGDFTFGSSCCTCTPYLHLNKTQLWFLKTTGGSDFAYLGFLELLGFGVAVFPFFSLGSLGVLGVFGVLGVLGSFGSLGSFSFGFFLLFFSTTDCSMGVIRESPSFIREATSPLASPLMLLPSWPSLVLAFFFFFFFGLSSLSVCCMSQLAGWRFGPEAGVLLDVIISREGSDGECWWWGERHRAIC